MNRHENIIDFIKTIRESFGSSIAVYTSGNCYQFYGILKYVYSDAVPYYDGNHVWTKIGDRYYDIRGEKVFSEIEINYLKEVIEKNQIASLSVNKWTDERRNLFIEEYREHLKRKSGN